MLLGLEARLHIHADPSLRPFDLKMGPTGANRTVKTSLSQGFDPQPGTGLQLQNQRIAAVSLAAEPARVATLSQLRLS